ncbi:MAG: hypothetical protein F6K19_28105, partial [Cyanothece sp. SIO1E1]|nr:hypothetical protein [Cyanothece sp. SIO1E1]
PPADTTAPVATVNAANVTVSEDGLTSYSFSVSYSDSSGIDAGSLGNDDVIVTGPNGYSVAATFVTSVVETNGDITATYAVTPPGGSWDEADNGTYTVAVQAGAVSDASPNGNGVATAQADFTANLTDPAPVDAIRINVGGNAYTDISGNLWQADTFSAGGDIDGSTGEIAGTDDDPIYQTFRKGANFSYAVPLEDGDYRVELHFSENRFAKTGKRVFDVEIEGGLAIDNLDIVAAASGLNTALVTESFVTVTDGQLDLNFLAESSLAQLSGIAIFSSDPANDATAPTVTINAPEVTFSETGSTGYAFSVSYSDSNGIDAGSLGDDDVIVTGPNGYSVAATFLTSVVESNGDITATYEVPPPGDSWDEADNGTYTVAVQAGAVTDASPNNNGVAAVQADFSVDLTPPPADTTAPVATVNAANVTVSEDGLTSYSFSVSYSDSSGIDAGSLGNDDVIVTGPNGYSVAATFVTSVVETNGDITATYAVTPPGGSWDEADNGTYTVAVQAGAVSDASPNGNGVATAQADFTANLTDPAPVDAIRINVGGNAYTDISGNLWQADTFSAGGDIDGSTGEIAGTDDDPIYQTFRKGANFSYAVPLEDGDYRVELHFSENRFAKTGKRVFDVEIEGGLAIDNLDIVAAASGLNTALVTESFVTVTDGQLDLNFLAESSLAQLSGIAIFSSDPANDATAPTVTINAPEVTFSETGSTGYAFSVSYSDSNGIDAGSLGDDDVIVTGPNGYSVAATFLTSVVESNGDITATYEVPPPGDSWDEADNGTYTVAVQAGAVTDASPNNNGVAAVQADFSVDLTPPPADTTAPTANLNTSSLVVLPNSTEDVFFTVTYSDNVGIDAASIDSGDITVTAPDGVTQLPVTLASLESNTNSLLTVIYGIAPPGGTWDEFEGGVYSVTVNSDEVTDNSENPLTSGVLGDFSLEVTIPSSDGITRINAGASGDALDSLGKLWQADNYFIGGTPIGPVTNPIADTTDDFIYQVQRTGSSFSYAVPVENGNYMVKLHLAELTYTDFNEREFDVSIEGELAFDNLDIYGETRNAFLDGTNTAKVLAAQDSFNVQDGVLDFDFTSVLNDVTLAGLEIAPIVGPQVLIRESDGQTLVSEFGNTDTYEVVLNTQPTDNVTVELQLGNQLTADKEALVFTADNWNVPQTVTVAAVDDFLVEGLQTAVISHSITTNDPNYSNLAVPSVDVDINDNDAVEVKFDKKTVANLEAPTTAAWGPDGRLYVGTITGDIVAYTFDDSYNVTDSQTISTLSAFNGVSNPNILGIAFNPYENIAGGQPKIYVAHSQLYANGGTDFDPLTVFSPYSGQVSVLEGPDFSVAIPLVTGIGVSNHDHGVNGLEFDAQGNLLIAVGGNTNAGILDPAIGGIDESPFTAAIIKAEITKADFNGNIQYEFPEEWVAPDGLTIPNPEESQGFGSEHFVAPGVDVSVYASGLRNPWDLEWTTQGLLYATDNGANTGFGSVSTGPDTQEPFVQDVPDELNLVAEGQYYGHPNRNRGRADSRQNVYYSYTDPSDAVHTAPLTTFNASTNGIIEYRSTTFGGQLRGNLLTQRWNGGVRNVELSADGTQVEANTRLRTLPSGGESVASGLDILTGFAGAIVGVNFSGDNITVATPIDDSVGTAMVAYDILEWRAPASGNGQFVIGGDNFSGLVSDTTVTIGGEVATVASVSNNRIFGTLPSFTDSGDNLLDIVVQSNGQTSTIADAFQPLFV